VPIFEYYCTKCKELFEELVTGYDTEKALCPKCNRRENTQKCISAVSIGKKSSIPGSSSGRASCSPGPFS
jgi:putative FmdB family regulatory protein